MKIFYEVKKQVFRFIYVFKKFLDIAKILQILFVEFKVFDYFHANYFRTQKNG